MSANPVLFQAVEDIKKLSRSLKGIVLLGEELEQMASVEQAIGESKARLAATKDEEAKAADLLLKLLADVESAKKDALATKENAEHLAKQLVKDAQAQALDALSQAELDVALLKGTAEADRKAAEATLYEMRTEVEALAKQASALRAELANLKAERDAILEKFGGAK